MMIRTPKFTDFNYDTITHGQAWPWFKGAAMILLGCMLAGQVGLYGGNLMRELPQTSPSPDYEI
jgi:hypothetical protein